MGRLIQEIECLQNRAYIPNRSVLGSSLLQALGLEVVERRVERNELYIAEECFLTGTAAHVNPVVEIDHRPVGDGEIGPTTRRLQSLYQDIIRGRNEAYMRWCTPVY